MNTVTVKSSNTKPQFFTVPGEPIPAARPRRGRFGGVFLPKRTVDAKNAVRKAAEAQGVKPVRGKAFLIIRFCRSTKRKADVDNLTKTIMDGMMSVAFDDDSVVVGTLVSTDLVPKNDACTEVWVFDATRLTLDLALKFINTTARKVKKP